MRRDEALLKACSIRLAGRRKWAWLPGAFRGLVRPLPQWANRDGLKRYYQAQKDLLLRGRLVWGCIVQANSELFGNGHTNWPAEIVFSLAQDQDTASLSKLANALFSLKGTSPAAADAKRVADHLTAETERVYGLSVPAAVDPEQKHRLSTVMVVRQNLPNNRLSGNLVPLLVLDSKDCAAMILPSEFWPMVLRWEWGLPEPKMTMGLLLGYKLVALFYLFFGMFLGGLIHLTADGKLLEYSQEHPVGVSMILLTNIVGLIVLKRLKSRSDDLPELRPEHLQRLKWYQLGGIPVTDRVAFLLWFVVYVIGLICGIVFGM